MLLFKKKQPVPQLDAIREKEEHLKKLNRRSTSAINVVSNVMEEMSAIDAEIMFTISEIDAYVENLTSTKKGLVDTFDKNERIKKNFAKLLEAE